MNDKFEFIAEQDPVSKVSHYYTQKNGFYVNNSLSHDKDKAYIRFINISSGVNLEPNKEIIETIYKLT
jgi:urease beta subunit